MVLDISRHRPLNDVVFNSGGGRIEGKYYQCDNQRAPAVLILHPHPLYGGSMRNKVVYRMFDACIKANCSALRFNFRGVGQSQGVFDHGVGELIDAATALDWLQNNVPEASSYWIMGFSFGAWIAMQLLMRRPDTSGFVIAAPPANLYDFSFISPCPTSGLIIQGSKDNVVPEDAVFKLWERLSKQRGVEIDYQIIEDADHMFAGHLDDVTTAISGYLGKILQSNNISHIGEGKKRDRRRRFDTKSS